MSWQIHKSFLSDFSEKYADDPRGGGWGVPYTLIHKRSGRSTIGVRGAWSGRNDVVVKQYRAKAWVECIKYSFRESRAQSEWRMNRKLREIGLSVPLILAWGRDHRLGMWFRSVLIMEAIQPGTRLNDYLRERSASGSTRELVERLAAHVASMHNEGFHHRDLHGDNILVGAEKDGIPALFFVDLHETRKYHPIREWMWVDDLGRLNGYITVPLRCRVLFLRRYLAERGIEQREWKTWARRIDKRTRQIWERHYRKRGKRIDTY